MLEQCCKHSKQCRNNVEMSVALKIVVANRLHRGWLFIGGSIVFSVSKHEAPGCTAAQLSPG